MIKLTEGVLSGLPNSERLPPSFLEYYVWAYDKIESFFPEECHDDIRGILLADDMWRVVMEAWAYLCGNEEYKNLRKARMKEGGIDVLMDGLELDLIGVPIYGIVDDLHDQDIDKTVYRVSMDTGIFKFCVAGVTSYIVRINTDDRELTLVFAEEKNVHTLLDDLVKRVPVLHAKQEGVEVNVIGGSTVTITDKVVWGDLELEEHIKKAIEYDIKFFLEKKDWFKERRIPRKRSWLFEGPPGNGKTSLIKLIATLYGKFLSFKTVAFNSIPEHEITKALNQLRKDPTGQKDVLAFIEDLDRTLNDPDTKQARSLEPFLNFYDGAAGLDGVLIITTANRPELLDRDAMLGRKGRFDRHFHFGPPTPDTAYRFMKRMFDGSKVTDDVLVEVAKIPRSYSYFKELFITSATLAFDEDLSDSHVLDSLELDVPSSKLLDRSDKRIGPPGVDHISSVVKILQDMQVVEEPKESLLPDGPPSGFDDE